MPIKEEVMKRLTLWSVLIGALTACTVSARSIDYSEYSFTKMAELVICGEVLECRTNGSYLVRVDRVAKGKYSGDLIELPHRYFYRRAVSGWEELPLAQHTRAVLFLQYTKNGEHDGLIKAFENKVRETNRQKGTSIPIPQVYWPEGYEVIAGEKGAQVRKTKKELDAVCDVVERIDAFLREPNMKNMEALFRDDSLSRFAALEALADGRRDLFEDNRREVGNFMVRCLDDADLKTRNYAVHSIRIRDYREATKDLESLTNSPSVHFRSEVLSALKHFSERPPIILRRHAK